MSQDLQATHQILTLLENSKSLSDHILDHLSGIAITTDQHGGMLRANLEVSNYLKLDHEDILGLPLSRLFQVNTWKEFNTHFRKVVQGDETLVEFELPIDAQKDKVQTYHWQIQKLDLKRKKDEQLPVLVSIMGKDISEIKRALARVVRLESDIELTQAVQSVLLPAKSTYTDDHFNLAGFCCPASQVGGDFWWYEKLKDNSLLIFMGDVTGHGVAPAMVTSFVCGAFHSMKDLLQENSHFSLEEIFVGLNLRLMELKSSPYWMTASALRFQPDEKKAEMIIAGAPPIVQIHSNGEFDFHFSPSSVLGSGPLSVFNETVDFQKGDRFVILTDGLLEAPFLKGRDGWGTVMKSLLARSSLSVAENAQHLRDLMEKHSTHDEATEDDKTFALIECK